MKRERAEEKRKGKRGSEVRRSITKSHKAGNFRRRQKKLEGERRSEK